MNFNKFQQGDSVTYTGKKESLRGLSGREGFVTSRVGGEASLLCVTFGDDAYLLDEYQDLGKYVKREKVDHSFDRKGPDVQKRRGVSGEDGKGRGGKRRKGGEEE